MHRFVRFLSVQERRFEGRETTAMMFRHAPFSNKNTLKFTARLSKFGNVTEVTIASVWNGRVVFFVIFVTF
jgi:hypothetical protein